jgi:hypothetical protein
MVNFKISTGQNFQGLGDSGKPRDHNEGTLRETGKN